MERTDEAIFNRASEEHIRQPIPYDDSDSVKVKFVNHILNKAQLADCGFKLVGTVSFPSFFKRKCRDRFTGGVHPLSPG